VILYSRGKGKELKDAEQGCIADTLTFFERKKGRRRAVCSLTKVNTRAIRRQRLGLQQAILRLQYIE
jgi:hypothetical protein